MFIYQSLYSFWDEKFFPGFQQSLRDLYARSIRHNRRNILKKNISLTKQKADLEKIRDFCNALEYYYISLIKLGIITKQNYDNVLEMLSQIDVIKLFCKNDWCVFGITRGNRISINTKKIDIGTLSSKAGFQMIVSHELGHIIDNSWLEDAMAVSKNLFRDKECHDMLEQYNLGDLNHIFNGFILIDEAVSQECAERVTYRMIQEKRPSYIKMRKQNVFSETPFRTNFNFYEELQEVAVKFARCLRFVGCSQTDDFNEVLGKLAKKAFRRDFIFQIWKEIQNDSDKKCDFVLMLACMGKIKDDSYANLDMEDKNSHHNITGYLKAFRYLAAQNKCLTNTQNKQKVMSNANNCGIFV